MQCQHCKKTDLADGATKCPHCGGDVGWAAIVQGVGTLIALAVGGWWAWHLYNVLNNVKH